MLRRRFLQTAAAATAAPLILPARVFGQQAPSNHVRLAAIGCGSRGSANVLRNFVSALPDARVVVACDCFKRKRENFARKANEGYGAEVCAPVADFREVLARPDIDGVIISTQDHWHVPLAYAAIAAGKDVYVEKPLSIAFAWAQQLRALAAKKKAVVQYGTQQRGDQPQFRRACELVRNGYLGDVREILAWCPDMSQQFKNATVPPYGTTVETAPPAEFDYDAWIGPAPMRPYTADRCTQYGGYHIYDYAIGFIAGWGAHPLDIAQWGLDRDHTGPVRVAGTGQRPPAGSLWDTIESYDVHYEYADGLHVRLMGHRVAEPVVTAPRGFFRDHGTMFKGARGWIIVDRSGLYCHDKALQTHEVGENEIRLTRTASQARNFVDAMRSRGPTISPLESAIRSDTLSHLGDIAIRTQSELRWDPVAEKIVGNAAAARMLDRPLRSKWNLLSAGA